jgi:hypothetical protein
MVMSLSLLVDPAGLSGLVADNVAVLEPESNLLLGALDGIGAVADVSADIDGEVTADGAGGGGQRVGGAKEDWRVLVAEEEGWRFHTYHGQS